MKGSKITRRRSRERSPQPAIDDLVEALVRRLAEVFETEVAARSRVLAEEWLRAAARETREAKPKVASLPSRTLATSRARAVRRPVRPRVVKPAARSRQFLARLERPKATASSPQVDPEHVRRDAELARLRAVLRPTAPAPTPASPSPMASPPVPLRAEDRNGRSERNGSLASLEDAIRDQLPVLGGLSQVRCTARIAAWAGRVRLEQSRPGAEQTRVAALMLLEKLRRLARAMDAGSIEALNASWSTRNWERYIEANELTAATPDADPIPAPDPVPEPDGWSWPA